MFAKNFGGIFSSAAVATLLFAAPVNAQVNGEGSMAVGNATVSVGGGTAILTLPDVPSLVFRGRGNLGTPFVSSPFKFSDDFDDEIGWNVNGSIEVPMGANKTVSLNGFWANIDDEHSHSCDPIPGASNCVFAPILDDPNLIGGINIGAPLTPLVADAERDVDQWGISLEIKKRLNPSLMGVTQAPPRRFIAFGADIRGIDQDLDVALVRTGFAPGTPIFRGTYTESLDTRYYGAFAAWGGDVNPFLFKGLWEKWGLQSSFQLRGGIYYADTNYEGFQTSTQFGGTSTALSLSDDDVAFIGGLVTETSKRIGQRSTLSLRSEYEYYSYVPEMAYNQVDTFGGGALIFSGAGGRRGTVINDDDAFSMRTSLRLTIGLGPSELYQ